MGLVESGSQTCWNTPQVVENREAVDFEEENMRFGVFW